MSENDFINNKKALFEKLYSDLNPMQRKAVFSVNGPLLVLAGAGSGKTTVLVNRIMQIIRYGNAYEDKTLPDRSEKASAELASLIAGGTREQIESKLSEYACAPAHPWEVLCITFTNKAANEFKERLHNLLGDEASQIWAGTFHSVCVRILRSCIDRLGISTSFTIYDSDDTKKMIAQIMKELNIDDRILSVKSVVNAISSAKEEGVLPADYGDGKNVRLRQIREIYTLYQKRLAEASALDFDDIILNTIIVFTEFPDVLEKYRAKFRYILVDEYQDTNPSQNKLITMLGGGRENVCVVGDDDQSIYSFRGATVENILNFDKAFSRLRTVKLEQNYRSTKTILDAANAVISNNIDRKGKELWTDGDSGDKINVRCVYTQAEEGEYIVDTIQKLALSRKYKCSDMAILIRVNALANSIENAFSRHRVPYRVYGGIRFFERREIKDIVAYLSVMENPADNVRLRRIINIPKRQIGEATVDAIASISVRDSIPMYDVIANAANYPELLRSVTKLKAFCDLMDGLREFAAVSSVPDTVDEIVKRIKYKEMLVDEDEIDKVENVAELTSSAVLYTESSENPTLGGFLEDIALVSDIDNYDQSTDAVSIMTVHSAKGLEFPVVFIPGFEEGVFPSQMSIGEGHIEEERRLAYVAVTRAKKELYITYTQSRLLYGMSSVSAPSSFLREIPEDLICRTESAPKERNGMPQIKRYERKKPVDFVKPQEIKKNESFDFAPGDIVEHRVFGKGRVISSEAMGRDMLVEVEFESGVVKSLMASFAKLIKL